MGSTIGGGAKTGACAGIPGWSNYSFRENGVHYARLWGSVGPRVEANTSKVVVNSGNGRGRYHFTVSSYHGAGSTPGLGRPGGTAAVLVAAMDGDKGDTHGWCLATRGENGDTSLQLHPAACYIPGVTRNLVALFSGIRPCRLAFRSPREGDAFGVATDA